MLTLENIVAFDSPAALKEAADMIDSGSVMRFREIMIAALDIKMANMENLSEDNASAGKRWKKAIAKGEHDSALRVMSCMNIPLDFFLRKIRGEQESESDTFNFYGIPKSLMLGRMMLSAHPIWGDTSDARTTRGSILALLQGKASGQKKDVTNFLNDYMRQATGKATYNSGGTQSSSSLHACAAMGLINIPTQGNYVMLPHSATLLRFLVGEH